MGKIMPFNPYASAGSEFFVLAETDTPTVYSHSTSFTWNVEEEDGTSNAVGTITNEYTLISQFVLFTGKNELVQR